MSPFVHRFEQLQNRKCSFQSNQQKRPIDLFANAIVPGALDLKLT